MSDFELTAPIIDETPRHGLLCCVECFEFEWLRRLITLRSRQTGTCDFCNSDNVALIEVSYLSNYFLNMASMYSPVSSENTLLQLEDAVDAGEFLDNLIQEDWEIFSERLLEEDAGMDLLEAILDARYTADEWRRLERENKGALPEAFERTEVYTSRENPGDYRLIDAWDEHKKQILVSTGRPKPFAIGREDFERITNKLPEGYSLHRARVGFTTVKRAGYGSHDEPYRNADIGSPPASSTRDGRANHAGQVVLYCADQMETAVAEVRPARGNLVSVGLFKIKRELEVLDLAMDQPPINPLTQSNLSLAVELADLFEAFGKDLAAPLRRNDDVSEYKPSQNLTDAVRMAKFDGIRYPSAMKRDGSNIVLFDPNGVEFVNSKLVRIDDVIVQFTV